MTTARTMRATKSVDWRPARRVRIRSQRNGIGMDSSMCAIEPAPTTGRPSRKRWNSRMKNPGGPRDSRSLNAPGRRLRRGLSSKLSSKKLTVMRMRVRKMSTGYQ
ncbi:hypothetical protein TRAPUB_13508 [Trametes pubescens]|uniref:Uncharacterized protein n=1 Tax=Trametes pubescens TaxID=154538 RepID=A0A1M2VQY5_TRAPU|nr:hypothetical protein TRAPUB_13508 [Trametes pubescens]